VIYSVVNCKAEGVRRDSVVLGCEVCNKSDCQSNTCLSHLTRDNIKMALKEIGESGSIHLTQNSVENVILYLRAICHVMVSRPAWSNYRGGLSCGEMRDE
jgi:hypothetical protein